MKKSLFAVSLLLALTACKNNTNVESEDTVVETENGAININTDSINEDEEALHVDATANDGLYASFGDEIDANEALTNKEMFAKYKSLKPGDTVNVKFRAHINDVCQKKGCWMSLGLEGEKESFVKFKDYAFFVPLNASGQDAVVSGKAFVSEISVKELRHYAKDGGKSEAEIAKITEPEITYGFMADGVLITK